MLLGLCLLIFSGLVSYLCWFTYELNLRVRLLEESAQATKDALSKLESISQVSKKAPPKPKKPLKKLEK